MKGRLDTCSDEEMAPGHGSFDLILFYKGPKTGIIPLLLSLLSLGREQGAMNGERREREGQARRNILLCHIGNGLLQMTSSGAPVNGRGRKCSGPGDHLPVVTQ